MTKLICSLTEENLTKKRCIGHPKTIIYQNGKLVKIPFLGGNENRCHHLLRNISKYIKAIDLLFYINVDKIYLKTGMPNTFTG